MAVSTSNVIGVALGWLVGIAHAAADEEEAGLTHARQLDLDVEREVAGHVVALSAPIAVSATMLAAAVEVAAEAAQEPRVNDGRAPQDALGLDLVIAGRLAHLCSKWHSAAQRKSPLSTFGGARERFRSSRKPTLELGRALHAGCRGDGMS